MSSNTINYTLRCIIFQRPVELGIIYSCCFIDMMEYITPFNIWRRASECQRLLRQKKISQETPTWKSSPCSMAKISMAHAGAFLFFLSIFPTFVCWASATIDLHFLFFSSFKKIIYVILKLTFTTFSNLQCGHWPVKLWNCWVHGDMRVWEWKF